MDVPVSTLTGMLGMNVKMKKRRGKVGAGLPLEPWGMDDATADPSSPGAETSAPPVLLLPPQTAAATPDHGAAAPPNTPIVQDGEVKAVALEEESAVEPLAETRVEGRVCDLPDEQEGGDCSTPVPARLVDMRCMKDLPPVPLGKQTQLSKMRALLQC